jgi:DNA-binding LacI/PurR family transcriptional regulator
MKDIAAALGLSINAVSLALNNRKGISEETRIKVLETARDMGYLDKESRFANTFRHHHLCVLMQDMYRYESFYGEILHSVVREARNYSYDVILQHFNDERMTIPNCLASRRVGGIIILGKISDENIRPLLSFPLVIVDHAPRMLSLNCVRTDNISGGFMAAEYLISRGFSKIGFFGDPSYTVSVRERYYGFLEALYRRGVVDLDKTDSYIKKYSLLDRVEPQIISLDIAAVRKKLEKKKTLPEAFFCSNDQAAGVLIRALEQMGIKVPEDVSVMGFDNGRENTSPRLTSINVHRDLMGKKAVQRVIRLIEDEGMEAEHTVLEVELVERESVKVKAAD